MAKPTKYARALVDRPAATTPKKDSDAAPPRKGRNRDREMAKAIGRRFGEK